MQTHSLSEIQHQGNIWKGKIAYGKKVKSLETEQVLGDSPLGKPPEARQKHCPLSEPSPHTQPQSSEADCKTLAIT